jgi:hypothetical protein
MTDTTGTSTSGAMNSGATGSMGGTMTDSATMPPATTDSLAADTTRK